MAFAFDPECQFIAGSPGARTVVEYGQSNSFLLLYETISAGCAGAIRVSNNSRMAFSDAISKSFNHAADC
jgi:hypothetical protein